MKRILVVDGSNLLFQMFFGMPARIVNAQGKAIQGTVGFVGALLKIIRMAEPTNVLVLFDGEHENERTKLDAEYKADRVDYSKATQEENPFSQLPDVYAALDYLGIKHTETESCEADDLISGYVFAYKNTTEIIIASQDSDFFQLICENVSVLRYRGEKTVICDTEYIKEKLGITPGQYADYKALVGDRADNIKGAEKIGQKTASMLLNEFGTLKRIIECADRIKKPSVKESVIKNAKRLESNYTLIKPDGFENLPFDLNETEYRHSGITASQVLKGTGIVE